MAEASAFEWTTEREVVLFEQLRHFPPFGLHRSVHLLALSSLLSHRFGLPCAPSDVALKVSLHFDTAALDAISFGRSTSRPVHLSSLAPPDAAPSPAALAVVPPSSDEPPPGDEGEGPPDKRQKRGGGSGVGGGRSKPKLDAAVAANVRRLNADFVKWETAYNAAISAEKPQISGATVWTFAAMLQLGAERAAVAIEDVFAACDAMRDKVTPVTAGKPGSIKYRTDVRSTLESCQLFVEEAPDRWRLRGRPVEDNTYAPPAAVASPPKSKRATPVSKKRP